MSRPQDRQRWYQTNKTRILTCTFVNNLRREFGVSAIWYLAQWQHQGGRCAICGKPEQVPNRRLAVDHCHRTGSVRELLCFRCNRLVGQANDNPEVLRRAATYVEVHA